MTYDALANGPTWFQDYGLYGMQYGAQQMTSGVKMLVDQSPNRPIIISPNWANGIIDLMRFFLPYEPPGQMIGTGQSTLKPLPIHIADIEYYLNDHLPLNEEAIFVLTPQDYEKATTSGKFTDVKVIKTIPYPNGKPGFYFVTLRYVENDAGH
jgi:hypothetical protein